MTFFVPYKISVIHALFLLKLYLVVGECFPQSSVPWTKLCILRNTAWHTGKHNW